MRNRRGWAIFIGLSLAVFVGAALSIPPASYASTIESLCRSLGIKAHFSRTLAQDGLPWPACWTAAVTVLCATWWILEPIPIPATSLIPFVIFPAVGVLSHTDAAKAYGDKLILLLMGGAVLSQAMEKSGAHRRVAIGMIRLVGGASGRRMVLGFMLASAFLSMWISNTATALMLLPVALAVISDAKDERLATPLLLGIAYASSVGGIGTPIGTPPNLFLQARYNEYLRSIGTSDADLLSFVDWMKIGVPVVIIMLPIVWLWITRHMRGSRPMQTPKLGAWRSPEVRVLLVFAATAVLWMTRKDPWGGWAGITSQSWWPDMFAWFDLGKADDSNVALAACVALFLLPDGEGGQLLDWESAKRVPWGLLLLFGGGLAIAAAFESSGLSGAVGDLLKNLLDWPLILVILAICLCVTFMTEVTSNTATAALLLPILLAAAKAADIKPLVIMAPAAISASCAFMLPVATPPNAVVFGADYFTVRQMAREGFVINLVGAVVITLLCILIL